MFNIAQLRPTVNSIIFFGAPHRGLEVTAMQTMVQGTPSEYLIRELEMHSPTLRKLNDGFRRVYGVVDILTIYEMEPTPSLRKNESNIWERTGPPVMMVEKDSAILHWPIEVKIGLNQDHSRIAKVDRGQNGCYDFICHFLQKSLGFTHEPHMKPNFNPQPHSSALPSSSKDLSVTSRQLCEAIEKGDCETARDLAQSVEKGWLAKLGGEPLCLAVKHCPEIVSTLLDAGADVSAEYDGDGIQAIHKAGKCAKNPDTVRLLLVAGADVNARSASGWTPLHHAASSNVNPEIVRVFIDAGAAVNVRDIYNFTPLHTAALHSDTLDVLRELIKANADVNATNDSGSSPLMLSMARKDPEICRELLAAGVNPNQRDIRGRTALHKAVKYGKKAFVGHLLDYGADPRAVAKDGTTPRNQKFPESVPAVTRNEIRELISKAARNYDERRRPGSLQV